MAAQPNVKREVIEMETRMAGGDVLLDPALAMTASRPLAPSPTWPMHRTNPRP